MILPDDEYAQIKTDVEYGFGDTEYIISRLLAELDTRRNFTECNYCAAVFANTDPTARTHWRDCPQHPAREVLLRLEQENAKLQADRDYWAGQARLLHDTVVAQLEEIENS
jgi:hypothetical protein